jgi:hypothetical protein
MAMHANLKSNLKAFALCATGVLLSACGSRVTEREVIREQPVVQPRPAAENITIVQQPPAPLEQIPAAPAGYSWVPGHYVWGNGRWVWEPGQWHAGAVRPMPPVLQESPPSAPLGEGRWVSGYWTFSGSDWVWTRGHWE